MRGWGEELWDRVEGVLGEVGSQADQLGQVYARFIRERGEVEREYAKNLRKLVMKFSDGQKTEEEDSSQIKGFRYSCLYLTSLDTCRIFMSGCF